MSWTLAEKEAMARASSSSTLKWAFELRHSTFPSHVRLANHDKDIDLLLEASAPANPNTTQTFIGTALRFKEPDISLQPDPTVSVELDGVSGALQPYLRAAITSGERILLTLRGFMYDVKAESVVQNLRLYNLEYRNHEIDMVTISIKFGYTNPANQAFPRVKYSALSNPGLA